MSTTGELTTTARNACDVVIFLDNAAGTACNISGSSNNVVLSLSNDIGEFKAFGNRFRYRVACGQDATITLDVVFSTASDEGYDIIKNWWANSPSEKRTITVQSPDGTSGSDEWSAEVVLSTAEIGKAADEANPVIVSCELMISGPLSLGQVA